MKTNQNGFVVTEFLLAISIAFGLTILTFAMTFTLSTVEVVQYIVYSSSRAHAAANFDPDAQKEAARRKYDSLARNQVFLPLFTNGWFEISKAQELEIRSGNGDNFERDYGGSATRMASQGVRANFKANLLEMRVPFLGQTTAEDDKGFVAKINAILIREVSMKECQDFFEKERPNALLEMGNNRFSVYRKTGVDPVWEDNGC